MILRARKDGAALVDGESVVVAEGVAVLGEAKFGDFGNELFGDEADVFGAAVFVFGRNGVGGQQCGDDARRAFLIETGESRGAF